MVRGLTNAETADLLGVSHNTVRNTLARVFEKVGVSRRSELAFVAQAQGPADESVPRLASGRVYRRQVAAVDAIKTGRTGNSQPWL